jgi:hypothetical protein
MNSTAGTGRAIAAPNPAGIRPAWRAVNITPAERLGRIIAGLAAIAAGAVMLAGAGSALEALLAAAGLDLAVTGALGHCPLYARLGYLPRSLRRPR